MILEFFKDYDEFGFCLKSNNGIVMMASKGYKSYRKCVEGWRTIQKALYIDDFDIRYRWSKEML